MPSSVQIVNAAEEGNNTAGFSDEVKTLTPPNVLIDKNKEALKEQGFENPTNDDATKYMNNKVNIVYKNLGTRQPFFDYSSELGMAVVTINTDHIFYSQFFNKIKENNETKVAFELFMASLIKAVDELQVVQRDENDKLIQEWNHKLRKYIDTQNNGKV